LRLRSVLLALEVPTDAVSGDGAGSLVLEELEIALDAVVLDLVGTALVFDELEVASDRVVRGNQLPAALLSLHIPLDLRGGDGESGSSGATVSFLQLHIA